MKISYKWLREYVNTKVRPNLLAHWLTMAGHEVSSVKQKAGDFIFDIDVTPNRPDCLSHLGIAREISAITDKPFKAPRKKRLRTQGQKQDFRIIRDDENGCPFYTARVLRGVKVGPSPLWLVRRLNAVGLQSINNVVDITNFVLFETGQPLHVFDMDRLSGDEIIIRPAKIDEQLVTIDGTQRTLNPGVIVIGDRHKVYAIAGIIGGADSAISPSTKNVLLESACFDPVRIRRSSLALGLSTDSSYRFERGADSHNTIYASDRAACLMKDIAKAHVGAFFSSGKQASVRAKIILRVAYLNKILGTAIRPAQARQILVRLGYKAQGGCILEVSAPSYRQDTWREADLIEEVARIYGYERIAAVAPSIVITSPDDNTRDLAAKHDMAKDALMANGFNEVISYSLIGRDMIKDMPWDEDDCITVKNPQSKEQEIMRPSLIPGIIKTAAYNISRQLYDVRLFELSHAYVRAQNNYLEENRLAIALYLKPRIEKKTAPEDSFFRLKGVILCLMDTLGVKEFKFENTMSQLFDEHYCMAAISGSLILGCFGRLRGNIARAYGITGAVYAGEINFDQVCALAQPRRGYKPLPRFPYACRDISFAVSTSVEYQQIAALARRIGGPIVENIELLNEYRGKQIEQGYRGLAIRIVFRSREKTLKEEEINSADASIRTGIKASFGVILR